MDIIGCIGVLHLSHTATSCLMLSIFTNSPNSSNSFTKALEQSIVSIPINLPGISPVILPSSLITLMTSRLCFFPISKSIGECAGVTLSAPVPISISILSSSITGISLLAIGSKTFLPTNPLYLSSFGLTATALSPSIVSGRVVATINPSTPKISLALSLSSFSTNGYTIYANIPLWSSCSVSTSAKAVLQ